MVKQHEIYVYLPLSMLTIQFNIIDPIYQTPPLGQDMTQG